MATAPIYTSRNAQLDSLLENICASLELTETQHGLAENRYRGIGAWLAEVGSPLQGLSPVVFPQGSMVLQTTVKPINGGDFDLDLVCLVSWSPELGPAHLYRAIVSRIAENGHYRKILDPRPRCLRLNYAGDFHLDIVPARPHYINGGTCLQVPDRDLLIWCTSNPKGFASWFRSRSEPRKGLLAEKRIEPLPPKVASARKTPLQRALQLIKRNRDVVFGEQSFQPSSIVLTTIAGNLYRGEDSPFEALLGIVDQLVRLLNESRGILVISNPVEPSEILNASWQPESHRMFATFACNLQASLHELSNLSGMGKISVALSSLFCADITKAAITSEATALSGLRQGNRLSYGGPLVSLTPSTERTRPVPKNTFYGM